MANFSFYLVAFLVVLGVLIVVHELGHYAVARLCGVKVLRFSMGFGPTLLSRRFGPDRTEWSLSVLPLGGYVRMLDEREGEVSPDEAHRAFNRQSVGRRSAIVAAGPLANFLLAILIYWGMFWMGSEELRPLLGPTVAESPAARAGIQNGERVLKVNGEPVETWQDFRWTLLQHATDVDSIELEVINERQEIAFRRLDVGLLAELGWQGDVFSSLGLRFYQPEIPPVVGQVQAGTPGEQAGLRAGDRFVAIDGTPVRTWLEAVELIRGHPGKRMPFVMEREGRQFQVDITPEAQQDRGTEIGRIGVGVAEVPGLKLPEMRGFVRYGFVEAGFKAVRETWDKSVFSLVMFGKMLTGEASWRNLSGPVTIADYAGQSARMGIDYYLKFMALVSISLGILNLLPVPVLDGGHLMYHILEVIKGSPLSERAMAIGQQIGLSMLFVLMAFAFFNDLSRLL